jgi:hypothetical protein
MRYVAISDAAQTSYEMLQASQKASISKAHPTKSNLYLHLIQY